MGKEEGKTFIEHYGVKGMRWGVRRTPTQLARAAKSYRQSSKDAKAATKRTRFTSGDKDAPSNLTAKELEDRIKRMETEKRYNELNAKTVSKGQQHVNEVITNVGKKTVTVAATGIAIHLVKKGVEKKFGKSAADSIKYKK